MNKITEALKLAEEALENYGIEGTKSVAGIKCTEALAAIREAMADHSGDANEMVGCAYCDNPLFAGTKCNNCGRVTLAEPVAMPEPLEHPPLYPDENAEEQMRAYHYRTGWNECLEKCKSAISSSQHQEPVKQEPVAWRYNSNGDWIYKDRKVWNDAEPLYAAPVSAKREWVDLTDDEIDDAYTSDAHENTPKSFARAVISAFKEKNK